MKSLYAIVFGLILSFSSFAQETIYSDDFENGLGNWTLTGEWGLSTAYAYNGTYGLHDSPSGLYLNAQTTTATLDSVFDLSTSLDANIYFRMKYDIENGFDYAYVDMSANNGSTWTSVYTVNGENNLSTWADVNVNIGGFVANSQVKMRFRLYTDAGYQSDGIYIDSLRITKDSVDNAPPLIQHNPDIHYEGQYGVNERTVTITDISGVSVAEMYYSVDAGVFQTLTASDTNGDDYTFRIPAQDPGSYVDYYVLATDSSAQQNAAISPLYSYVAGNYIKYEQGVVDFITSYASAGTYSGTAMRMTLDGMTTITTAFIGNYTDVNNTNDSMQFHVWADDNGEPGDDLITPIMVFPAATLLQPHLITRIDLRPYEDDLDSLMGDVFVGFTVPSGTVWLGQTTPGTSGRVRNYNGSAWSNETDDYHFRIVTDTMILPPVADFEYDLTGDPTVVFSDSSENGPTSWHWTFGDGDTSNLQHPTHTYTSLGAYTACLEVTNAAGTDQDCKAFFITQGPPNANFTYTQGPLSGGPEFEFTDNSSQSPTSWAWTFGDGNTSTVQNPEHTYGDTGSYEVCLVATNSYGSDTACQTVDVQFRKPLAFFESELVDQTLYKFTDLSAYDPTEWHWDFDNNGDTSIVQNPIYTFPVTGGTFDVCLIASNDFGSSDPYCDELDVADLTGVVDLATLGIHVYPNPVKDNLTVTLPDEMQHSHTRIIAMDGRVLGNTATNGDTRLDFDTRHLTSGLYFIELLDGSELVLKIPFIVQQ